MQNLKETPAWKRLEKVLEDRTEDLKNWYLAYVLPLPVRLELLEKFPPEHADVICHHITANFNVNGEDVRTRSREPARIEIVSLLRQPDLECFQVRVNGVSFNVNSDCAYHLTHSIDRASGAKPFHSGQRLNLFASEPIDPIVFYASLELLRK